MVDKIINKQPQQNTPLNQPTEYEDEISLIDLWNLLFKRKKLIALVMVAVSAISMAYILMATPIYESSAVIAIGSKEKTIDGKINLFFLENPGLFAARAREQFGISVETSKNKNEPNILTLKSESNDPLQAQEKLEAAISSLLANHEEKIEAYNHSLSIDLSLIKTQQSEISTLLKQYENRIRSLEKQNPTLAAILTIDKRSLMEKNFNLQGAIIEMGANSEQPPTTEILRKPSLANSPIKPRAKLVFALSLMLGVFLGFFAAFLAEFFEKAREARI